MTFPVVDAHEFNTITVDEALAYVDEQLGPPDRWPKGLLSYRLRSEFQSDWKEQMGRWFHLAATLGFLEPAMTRILSRVRQATPTYEVDAPTAFNEHDANDAAHTLLHQETAALMAAYYLVNTGWKFGQWEPKVAKGSDVDLAMQAPDGTSVYTQVKAPDRLGNVVGGQIVGGEQDAWIAVAVDKACKQLAKAEPHPRIIVVSAARRLSLAAHPGPLAMHLFGSTTQYGDEVKLLRANAGRFFDPSWRHVSAVVALDYVRPVGACWYFCTVLKNPTAEVQMPDSWFPRAFIVQLDGTSFKWTPRMPGRDHGLPDGTELIERPPY